jgi:hypothetical protein
MVVWSVGEGAVKRVMNHWPRHIFFEGTSEAYRIFVLWRHDGAFWVPNLILVSHEIKFVGRWLSISARNPISPPGETVVDSFSFQIL